VRRLLAALLAALLLSGCAALAEPEAPEEVWEGYQPFLPEEPEEEEVPPEEPEYPAAFSLPYYRDQTLDPIACGEGVQETAASLLYEPLFRLDGQFQPQPLLCESWEWDESGLVCTLYLREGVAFSDGSALTARDVAEALLRARESERYAYRLRNVAAVAASRTGQVIITLAAPNRGLPALLDIPIVKRSAAVEMVPLGTGPYVFDKGEECLRLRTDWWQGKDLPLETIPLVHAKDRETALYLFSTRQVELLSVDPTSDPALTDGQAQANSQPTAVMQFIGFNTAEGRLFADPALRRLFSQGIDRETLADAQLVRLAAAAQFPISPLSSLYPTQMEAAYSEEETLAALRAAGQDTGERRELTLLVCGGGGFRASSARFIAEQLSLLDWRITVAELPWEEYLAALETGEFDLYFGEVRLTADWELSDLIGTEGALNYGAYASETTDLMLQSFAAAEDREAAAQRLCGHLQTVMPIAPVCFKNYSVLTHPGVVEGMSPAPAHVFSGFEGWTVHLKESYNQTT
jgi:ABC-type transport system substrate-binding protein